MSTKQTPFAWYRNQQIYFVTSSYKEKIMVRQSSVSSKMCFILIKWFDLHNMCFIQRLQSSG